MFHLLQYHLSAGIIYYVLECLAGNGCNVARLDKDGDSSITVDEIDRKSGIITRLYYCVHRELACLEADSGLLFVDLVNLDALNCLGFALFVVRHVNQHGLGEALDLLGLDLNFDLAVGLYFLTFRPEGNVHSLDLLY